MLTRYKLQRFSFSLVALALLAASSTNTPQADPTRYLADVKALASPDMEGRGDGSKGLTRAEHLIEKRYKELHLDPAGVNEYSQPFSVITGARLKNDNRCSVLESARRKDLKVEQDFVPFSFSSSGQVDAPLAFAGYGATADEFHYDDYAGLDVKDKIVLVLRYEPAGFAAKSGNHGLTHHSQLITKAINARNHGAKALIVLNGKLGDGEEDLLTRFGSVSGPENVGIEMIQVKNSIADGWFQAAGKTLKDVQEQINSSGTPASFSLPDNLHLALNIDIETTRATVRNVLAWLPGQSDEYVIVGAHYDHLGRGNFDSLAPSQIGQLHPGADDNASGTAGVLELARRLAPMKGKLRRGILFASFAGEELGLLGSAEWVKEPTRPLDKAVAMLNMEYSPGGYASSDHTSFVTKRIPVLFFFSGLHSDYHKPSDTWEKINAEGAVRLLDLVADVSQKIASAPERPAFITVAEDKPAASGSGGGGYG